MVSIFQRKCNPKRRSPRSLLRGDCCFGAHFPWKIVTIPWHSEYIPINLKARFSLVAISDVLMCGWLVLESGVVWFHPGLKLGEVWGRGVKYSTVRDHVHTLLSQDWFCGFGYVSRLWSVGETWRIYMIYYFSNTQNLTEPNQTKHTHRSRNNFWSCIFLCSYWGEMPDFSSSKSLYGKTFFEYGKRYKGTMQSVFCQTPRMCQIAGK